MDDIERKKLAEVLAKAEPETIREIIREAESFLEAQLKVGLASDSRAMTLGAFLSGIVSALVAGTSLMVAAEFPVWPHIIAVSVLVVSLCCALFSTVHAARPTDWNYTGNNPRFWASDVEAKRPLHESLAGQAALYAKGISENSSILEENQKFSRLALRLATWGAVIALAIEGFVVFLKMASSS